MSNDTSATGLPARAVACALVDLEAAGWVHAQPGGRYVLTAIAPIAGGSSS